MNFGEVVRTWWAAFRALLTDETFDLATLIVAGGLMLFIVWVMLRRTWHWTYLGRALLLVFLGFGLAYLNVVAWTLAGQPIPDWMRWFFRGVITIGAVLTGHALVIYPWPRSPERIRLAQLLGFERDGEEVQ